VGTNGGFFMKIRLSAGDDPTRLSKPPPLSQQPSPTNQPNSPTPSKTLRAQSPRRRGEPPVPNFFFPI
jgi:hypothetical protein